MKPHCITHYSAARMESPLISHVDLPPNSWVTHPDVAPSQKLTPTMNDTVLFDSRAKSPSPLMPVELEVVRILLGKDNEIVSINYKSDPRVYDSGHRLKLFYRRNEDEPEAIENKILDSSYHDKRSAVQAIVDELLPTVPHLYSTITRITLKTIGGKITTTFGEDVGGIIQYPPIPSHLSHIPTVPINELQKVSDLHGHCDVDRVQWKGETYAFKITGGNLEGTLRELTVLDKFSGSSHIIGLEAIVINHDSNIIRGFLSPFARAGDLESVFETALWTRGLMDETDPPTLFDWSLRLSWACQITRGVVELHSASAYRGDLAPQNVCITSSGQAVLDLLPTGFRDAFVAPEALEKFRRLEFSFPLTASADVYSLGLLLYAIAEEKCEDIHATEWQDGRTCAWYREIVKRCLVPDPGARPSAAEVLSLLENGEVLD